MRGLVSTGIVSVSLLLAACNAQQQPCCADGDAEGGDSIGAGGEAGEQASSPGDSGGNATGGAAEGTGGAEGGNGGVSGTGGNSLSTGGSAGKRSTGGAGGGVGSDNGGSSGDGGSGGGSGNGGSTDNGSGGTSGGGSGGTSGDGGSRGTLGIGFAGAPGFEQIDLGDERSCGLVTGGRVYCWGANSYGQLGVGTNEDQGTPAAVVGLSNAISIGVGTHASCAVLADGTAVCWGLNSGGKLGDGTNEDSTEPVQVVGLNDAVRVTVGASHACALLTDGTLSCWGSNGAGQLGDPNLEVGPPLTAAPVPGLTDVVDVQAGDLFTCAELASGEVECWGINVNDELADGTGTESAVPKTIAGLPPTRLMRDTAQRALAVGGAHVCAIVEPPAGLLFGNVMCWGADGVNQLGGSPVESGSPFSEPAGHPTALLIGGGDDQTCTRSSTGGITCWGSNANGELGLGYTSDSDYGSPSIDQSEYEVVQFASGETHTCALLRDRRAYCWGSNSHGQLGVSGILDRTEPGRVLLVLD